MINLPVPYFCQRENKYIWQQRSSDTGEKLPDDAGGHRSEEGLDGGAGF